MTRSNKNAQSPWTCASIGSAIASVRGNSTSFGTQEPPTGLINFQNITRPPTIKLSALLTCIPLLLIPITMPVLVIILVRVC